MKFVKWIVFMVAFALTEGAFGKDMDNSIVAILKSFQPTWNPSYVLNEAKFKNQSNNGILYNVTTKFGMWPPTKFEFPLEDNVSAEISAHFPSVSLEGYSRDSNHQIVTENFTINYVVKFANRNEFSIDYPNFKQIDIKLLANDYQYKSNEENEIKKEIKAHIKAILDEFLTENEKNFLAVKRLFTTKFYLLFQDRYYSIGNIPSTNYTLNNVTISGLWNVRSISCDVTNMTALPGIDIRNLNGSLVQNFPSTFNELSFKADNIYIWVNQNTAKVNVKAKAYSVINKKLNTVLGDDESKLIMEDIETAFAASLESAWKKSKPKKSYFRI